MHILTRFLFTLCSTITLAPKWHLVMAQMYTHTRTHITVTVHGAPLVTHSGQSLIIDNYNAYVLNISMSSPPPPPLFNIQPWGGTGCPPVSLYLGMGRAQLGPIIANYHPAGHWHNYQYNLGSPHPLKAALRGEWLTILTGTYDLTSPGHRQSGK